MRGGAAHHNELPFGHELHLGCTGRRGADPYGMNCNSGARVVEAPKRVVEAPTPTA